MKRLMTVPLLLLGLIAGFVAFGQLTVTRPFSRFFYPEGHPNRAALFVVRSWSWLVATGLVPAQWPGEPVWGSTTIVVCGRRSGKEHTTIATWIEHEGDRYFVSMSGQDSDWVKNVRAAQGRAELRRGARHPVRLEEVPVARRAEIIHAWYQRTWRATESRLGIDPHAGLQEFERLAPDHPVFRIAPPL